MVKQSFPKEDQVAPFRRDPVIARSRKRKGGCWRHQPFTVAGVNGWLGSGADTVHLGRPLNDPLANLETIEAEP